VQKLDLLNRTSKLEAEDHLDAFIARETVKFIRCYKDQPFFLISGFMKPHNPLFAPKEYADKYPIEKIELPEIGDISRYPGHIQNRINSVNKQTDREVLKASRAGYYACLEFVDQCIGMVYNELENLGLLDNTIVVYTSDHGEMNGDHGMYGKFTLFDPAARVPLIISHPARLGEGVVSDALTEYFGLFPTLCDLAGLEQPSATTIRPLESAPEKMDAKSFAETLFHPSDKGPEAAYCEFNQRSAHPSYMIRTDKYKYIYNEGLQNELYDLQEDPGEFINLAASANLEKTEKALKDQLFAWFNPSDNKFKNTSNDH
jgi:arylsulfatase A-like enzyme